MIEFQRDLCFKSFGDEVTKTRREGDSNSDLDVIAMKLIGNSGYGSLIMDVEKHQTVKYVKSSVVCRLDTLEMVV